MTTIWLGLFSGIAFGFVIQRIGKLWGSGEGGPDTEEFDRKKKDL